LEIVGAFAVDDGWLGGTTVCSSVFSEPKDHVYCSVVLFVLCPF
jgi:hypothetical protein